MYESALLYPVLLIMFSHAHSNNSAFDFNSLAAWTVISLFQALRLLILTTEVSGNSRWASTDMQSMDVCRTSLIPKTMLWDHRHMVGSLFNLHWEMKEQILLMHPCSLCLAKGRSMVVLL